MRWAGIAKTSKRIVRATLEANGTSSTHWTGPKSLVLETKDGPIDVDLSHAALELQPETKRKGSWEEVESDPLARPFARTAPGPHVRATLTTSEIHDGDALVVIGEAHGEALDGGGPRTPATRRAARIRATKLAAREAGDALAPEPEADRRPAARVLRPPAWLAVIGALVAAGLASVAYGIAYSPATLDLAMLAALVLGVALHWTARSALVFRTRSGRVDPRPWGAVFHVSWGFTFLFVAGVISLGDLPGHMNDGHQQNGSSFALVMYAVYATLLLVDLVRFGRNSARIARAILAAPPLREDRWGAASGTVRSREERAAVYALLEETWREGSGSNPRDESQHQSPFVIDGEGGEVFVEPGDQACWATDAAFAVEERAFANHEKAIIERSEISDGSRVIAVGRQHTRDDHRVLAPTGPESLLLFASARGNPRTVLATRLALWAFTTLLLGAVVLGSVTLAFWQPGMPPENMPETN